jgi:hypothetical protein
MSLVLYNCQFWLVASVGGIEVCNFTLYVESYVFRYQTSHSCSISPNTFREKNKNPLELKFYVNFFFSRNIFQILLCAFHFCCKISSMLELLFLRRARMWKNNLLYNIYVQYYSFFRCHSINGNLKTIIPNTESRQIFVISYLC